MSRGCTFSIDGTKIDRCYQPTVAVYEEVDPLTGRRREVVSLCRKHDTAARKAYAYAQGFIRTNLDSGEPTELHSA